MKKVALVTGASSGIGRMAAQELKAAGFQVYAAARRVDRMENLKAEGIKPVSLVLTVDDSIRAQIEELTGEDLVDEDYDSAVDGVIVWWRDGDDEDELSDTIVDAYAVLGNDGPLWILTPKPGRPGATSSSTVQSAAQTAGMNAATPLTVSSDWNGIRLRAFGKGR